MKRYGLILACLVACANAAGAAVPSPPDCDVPCGIVLVGETFGGRPHPAGQFTIVVRSANHVPIAGATVTLDFNACVPDMRICHVQPDTAVHDVFCQGSLGVIVMTTDASGSVTASLVGGSNNRGDHAPAADYGCGSVYADGVFLGHINVATYDQDGVLGGTPADGSVWFSDSFDDDFEGRSDINCSHSINPADLSLILGHFDSLSSCCCYCQ